MKILVVGAGVLGLTTAFNLVEDGHDVTIVDKTGPYAQASSRSFAWINANHKLPAEYHRLNRAGIAAHEEFQRRFASHGTWFHQHGCIMFDSTPDKATGYDERFTESAEFDYPVERIDSDRLRELEPAVSWPTDSGLFFPLEAHLDNEAFGSLVESFLEEADVTPEVAEVVRVDTNADGASAEFADGDTRNFDQVIIAAGADSGAIAFRSGLLLPVADLSQPGPRTHSLLGVTVPTDVSLSRIIISDKINVRPRHDGSMFVQIPSVEARTEEGESPELLDEVRVVMEAELQALFGKRIPVSRVIFSGRSFPEDGLSIVGYLDEHHRAYSLVTHSGMTMAPLLGRLVADEVRGDSSHLLSTFRPSRFTKGITQESPTNFIGRQ
ncbi:NAD(P)/FAD-dependent oxidoreductase [Brevibacterium sediminis]|uniref:FAD-dependent oxidoreductase n=1 Tax=Brevibacterium sediminis TaxID=1857024 RepID=A0ABQ1MIL1_9MICO|nr:FAD-binding oxidoreductase [Brevibacterium sediminis]GGC40378.1 FAD-dependent oxidoreductase [Brevibacterium sediminis]